MLEISIFFVSLHYGHNVVPVGKIMKYRLLFIITLFVGTFVQAQMVTNVQFQRVDKEVTLSYSLDKTADIRIKVSVDGGLTYGNYLENYSGDAGKNVAPGEKTVLFYDLPDLRGIPYVVDSATGVCYNDTMIVFDVEVDDGSATIRVGDVNLRMLMVAAGSFTMGCTHPDKLKYVIEADRPTHRVKVDTFYMSQFEVTQGLWSAVMEENPSRWKDDLDLPVENVSYEMAQTFINRLSQMTGYRFRLPTEAEWEFAARGGVNGKGCVYPGAAAMPNDVAWFTVNSRNRTHRVGEKLPNELGLYDMAGNVSEWCSDWYGQYKSDDQVNPRGPRHGENRILRGGSINSPSWACAVSARSWYLPDLVNGCCGFRLVLDSVEEPYED